MDCLLIRLQNLLDLVILNPLQRVKNPLALCSRETVLGFFALRAQNDMGLAGFVTPKHRNRWKLSHYQITE